MSSKTLFADFRDYITMKPEEAVRDFVDGFDWNLIPRNVPANDLPVARTLDSLDAKSSGAEKRLVASMATNLASLHWNQSYTAADFGQGFVDNYGFVEVFGTRGHYTSDTMSGGLLLIGPGQHYPSHFHVAEELYIPLTSGSYWMRDGGPFTERQVGEVIVHASNETHAMETPAVPLLALYMWRDGDLAQKPNY